MKFRWNRTMLKLCGIVAAILKMADTLKFRKRRTLGPTRKHTSITPPRFMKFCPVVPEICRGQFRVSKKERRKRIIIITRYDYNLTIMKSPKPAIDTIYPHIKFWWYRTMLIFCCIVVVILKMVTGRNFSMSGINSGHHYLPTYQILMISDNVEFLRYCGSHFENGRHLKI